VLLTSRANEYLNNWLSETPFDNMEDLIFFGQDKDSTVTRKTMSRRFLIALKRAEIKVNKRNLVIHSFRHTYNTLMRPLLPKEVLQSMTGHKTDSMTDRYDHPDFKIVLKNFTNYYEGINTTFDNH
jgi:integrase